MGRGNGSLDQSSRDILRSGFSEELLPDADDLARKGSLKRLSRLTDELSHFRDGDQSANWRNALKAAPLDSQAMQQLLIEEPIIDETRRFLEEIILYSIPTGSNKDFKSYFEMVARKIGLDFERNPLGEEERSALSLTMVLALQKTIRNDYNWNSLAGEEEILLAGKINSNLANAESVSGITLAPLSQDLADKLYALPQEAILEGLFNMDSFPETPIVYECKLLLSSLKESLTKAYEKESQYPPLDPQRIGPSILEALQEKGALARPVFVTALMSWNWPEATKIHKPSGPYSDRLREVINKHMQPAQRIRRILNIDSEPPAHYFPLNANESLEQRMSKMKAQRRQKLFEG
jgi:hypothetical protein